MNQSIRRTVLGTCAAAALAISGPPAAAQTASLVYDFGSKAPFAQPPIGLPSGLGQSFSIGERLFFAADQRLWVTDGKPNGTRSLNDLCRGACPAAKLVNRLGGLAFFAAGDPTGPLWRSDGTVQGTFAVTPPGWSVALPAGGDPVHPVLESSAVSLGGRLYFLACQGDGRTCGLWASDGTKGGTKLAAPGFYPGFLFAVGGRIFDIGAGVQILAADGTAGGPAASVNGLIRLAAAGDHQAFFVAGDPFTQDDLWVSDGTTAGTHRVRSFGGSATGGGIRWLKVQGDRAYLVATDGRTELWRSDGTKAGTGPITALPGNNPFFYSTPEQMVELGGRAVFLASSPSVTGLWATTGTAPATTLLAPLCSGDCSLAHHRLVQVGNRVVLRSETGMLASDGTPAGTVPLPCRGECLSEPLAFAGAALFLTAPFQLWQTDGTPQGTRRVADLSAVAGDATDFGLAAAPLGRRIAVTVPGDSGSSNLWVTDGTTPGTYPLLAADEGPSADLENLSPVGDRLLFSDCSANGDLWTSAGTTETTALLLHDENEIGCHAFEPSSGVALGGATVFVRSSVLWRVDGTAAGTRKLLDLSSSPTLGFSSAPLLLGSRLVLPLADGAGHAQLWESDGTPAGTRALFDFPAAARRPHNFRGIGDTLYFLAGPDIDSRVALWASDGTLAGTRPLTGLVDGNALGQVWLAPLGGSVYFNFLQPDSQTSSLWRTDGTAAGTVRVTTPGGFDIAAGPPVQLGAALYFFGSTIENGFSRRGLWRFDGDAGTAGPIASLESCQVTPTVDLFTVVGGLLFFTANDGSHGCELWQSDGTAAGTVRVHTRAPLLLFPDHLTAAAGRLFFTVDDGIHGRELWTSDGTEAGTRLVHDVAPGEPSSSPEQLTAAGGRLYFTADDGTTGRELWSLPLSGPACQPSATVLCLAAGRFQLQVTWRDFTGHTGAGQAVPLSADTGTFWFFDPANVEVIVKVLDARALDQSFWVFYGALSSVEYTLTVTDTQTGFTRRYLNPAGQLASFADTSAFGPLGAYSARDVTVPARRAGSPGVAARFAAAAASPCVASLDRLCLGGGRFAVTATWKDFSGNTGTGIAVALSGDTGYFWFFAPSNVEVVLKVLDGRGLNGKFWVFYGALSNVEYTLTVTDTQTGAVKTYRNPSGQLASVADTGAF